MFASHHKLDKLHVIVDNNGINMLGYTDAIVSHADLNGRLTAFSWDCSEVNGHDILVDITHAAGRQRNG